MNVLPSSRSLLRALLTMTLCLAASCAAATAAQASDVTLVASGDATLDFGYDNEVDLTVKSLGSATSAPTTVTIQLPAGVTAASASGQGWTCGLGATLTCTTNDGDYAAGQSYAPIALVLNVTPDAGATASIVSTVATADDVNAANNTLTKAYSVGYYNDVGVNVYRQNAYTIGTPEQIRIQIANRGHTSTEGAVVLTNPIPAGFNVTSIASGTDWSCSTNSANVLTCSTTESASPGRSFDQVIVNGSFAPTAFPRMTDTATVTYPGDENAANNTDVLTAPVSFLLDLTTTIPAPAAALEVGKPGSLVVDVDHRGLNATGGVTTLAVTIPPSLQVTGPPHGLEWTCSATAPYTCTLPAGKKALAPVTYDVRPTIAAAPGVTISAVATTDGEQNPADNSATATFGVTGKCVVPKLKGLSLKAARAAITNANCTVGRVKVRRKPKALSRYKTKKVVKTASRRRGAEAALGAKVGLTMYYVRKR